MPTINQLVTNQRQNKKKKRKNVALSIGWNQKKKKFFSISSPQRSGVCEKVGKMNPKKPNSALRSYARVNLSNNTKVTVYIPGESHNIQEFSSVLIAGGGAQDLPGVKYHVLRGNLDSAGVEGRKQGRSLYGTKKGRK
jgi:small subunit ribosomal protein S12